MNKAANNKKWMRQFFSIYLFKLLLRMRYFRMYTLWFSVHFQSLFLSLSLCVFPLSKLTASSCIISNLRQRQFAHLRLKVESWIRLELCWWLIVFFRAAIALGSKTEWISKVELCTYSHENFVCGREKRSATFISIVQFLLLPVC